MGFMDKVKGTAEQLRHKAEEAVTSMREQAEQKRSASKPQEGGAKDDTTRDTEDGDGDTADDLDMATREQAEVRARQAAENLRRGVIPGSAR